MGKLARIHKRLREHWLFGPWQGSGAGVFTPRRSPQGPPPAEAVIVPVEQIRREYEQALKEAGSTPTDERS